MTLRCTMVQRVRTAARVLPGNFLKIQSQDLSSFLYTQQALLVYVVPSAMLARAQTVLLVPARTPIIVAAGLGIAVAQSTVIVTA